MLASMLLTSMARKLARLFLSFVAWSLRRSILGFDACFDSARSDGANHSLALIHCPSTLASMLFTSMARKLACMLLSFDAWVLGRFDARYLFSMLASTPLPLMVLITRLL
jgi:hypothetical protein